MYSVQWTSVQVDQKGSAAMLATKKSVGVTPEMNLRKPLHAQVIKHANKGPTLTLKPRADINKSPKTGVSVAPQKGLMSSKNLGKKKERT